MEIIMDQTTPPVDRAYVISMVIKSFKGRRDVEAHLFRPEYDPEDLKGYDWVKLIGDPAQPGADDDPATAQKILLESFSSAERDQVLQFLQDCYADRVSKVSVHTLDFPIPTGLPCLSGIPEGKTIGLIRFEKIPSCALPFKMHGLYDLAQHEPLVQDEE